MSGNHCIRIVGWAARCAALALAVCAGPAVAGWPVTDVGAYNYYVQQIKKMSSQLETAQHQLDRLQKIGNTVDEVRGKLEGQYNRAKGVLDEVKRAKETVTGLPATVTDQGAKWGRKLKDLKNIGKYGSSGGTGGFVDATRILNDVFRDPREKGKPRDMTDHDRQYQFRQSSLKNAIAQADMLLQNMPNRLKTIAELGKAIDQTQNIKDSSDLGNRILVEILRTVTELLAVDARTTEAQSLLHYQGVTEATTKARLDKLAGAAEEVAQAGEYTGGGGDAFAYAEKELKKWGVDAHDMSDDDLLHIVDGGKPNER